MVYVSRLLVFLCFTNAINRTTCTQQLISVTPYEVSLYLIVLLYIGFTFSFMFVLYWFWNYLFMLLHKYTNANDL